ncbi:MAG: MBL fold metallo-hydrolase [Chrysiogenetes bacterium]|nr:MBL fold metallo-hydrolase [Chrysiogenetes bacterium]
MKRAHVLLLALALLAGGCDAVFDHFAEKNLDPGHEEYLSDGNLHVLLCGTGTPLVDPRRVSFCVVVIAGGQVIQVDAGPGSWRVAAMARMPRRKLSAMLITHFHSDHIGEIGEVTMQSWLAGRSGEALPIYGPPGIEDVVDGFSKAYAWDRKHRVDHHGAKYMPPAAGEMRAIAVPVEDPRAGALVLEKDGLRVTAFPVKHDPVVPAYGYKFEYRGRTLVISGDTAKSENVAHHAKGADMLIHEALGKRLVEYGQSWADRNGHERWAKLTRDVVTYHTSPVEAAQVAQEAGVKTLVYAHVGPLPNAIADWMFLRGTSDAFNGEIILGEDGQWLELEGR